MFSAKQGNYWYHFHNIHDTVLEPGSKCPTSHWGSFYQIGDILTWDVLTVNRQNDAVLI